MLIFISIAVAGFVFVAGGFLFGHDDTGHDLGHDTGHDVHPDAEGTISIFSTKVIGTFIMGFGAAGAIAMQYGANYLASSLTGTGSGVVLAAIMYVILYMFVKQQASSLVSTQSVVGCTGQVTTSIDADQAGEVGVTAEGQYRTYKARATGSQAIDKGRSVRVVRIAGGDAIVEEIKGS